MGHRGSAGAGRWVCLARIFGWYNRRECWDVGGKDESADVRGGLIAFLVFGQGP